jgi:hypothetical protein
MSGSTRRASALAARLLRLARVAQTIAWPALLGGALGCVAAVTIAAHDASPLGTWPGLGAVMLCAGAAFLLDDDAGAAADAAPTSLARRRMLRVALALPLLCGAWTASLWIATSGDDGLFGPGARAGLSVQFAAMLALTLAGSAVALRVRPDARSGWAGAVAPFVLLAVVYYVPQRWTMLAAPGDSAWLASQHRWIALLVLAGLTLVLATRDPAARGLRRRGVRSRRADPDILDCYRPDAR